MGRQYHRWIPEEIQFLRDNAAGRSYAEITEMFNLRFGCCITVKQTEGALINNGIRNFRDTRFRKGNIPFLKGKRGTKPPNYKPVGDKFINYRGDVMVKTAEPNVWRPECHLVWETANGPVPKGYALIFADRNRSNVSLDNLLLVSRRELLMMNRRGHVLPDRDLTRAGQALAALELELAERERELGLRRPKRAKKQGANRHDNGTETEAANRRNAGNNPAGKEAAV